MKFHLVCVPRWATSSPGRSSRTAGQRAGGDVHFGRRRGRVVSRTASPTLFSTVLLRPDIRRHRHPNLTATTLRALRRRSAPSAGARSNRAKASPCSRHHGTLPNSQPGQVNPARHSLRGDDAARLGWREAAAAVEQALAKTIEQKRVTYDLERQMEGATLLKTSQFAEAIVENL